ncbi:hypothetical protein DXG03_008731 [Asterophora parasitica]|uniref:Uncharacterized protein n=1 Tax=Asterophora parasitica TaxID=117018 RepID=A0A9P7G8V3_9AGAR|nr:hypothetical protein DXG03_008731 [Asterophora parasitica]
MSHLLGQRSSAASGSGGDAEGRGPSTYPDQDFMMTTRSEMWSRIDAGGDMATRYEMEEAPARTRLHPDERRLRSEM